MRRYRRIRLIPVVLLIDNLLNGIWSRTYATRLSLGEELLRIVMRGLLLEVKASLGLVVDCALAGFFSDLLFCHVVLVPRLMCIFCKPSVFIWRLTKQLILLHNECLVYLISLLNWALP